MKLKSLIILSLALSSSISFLGCGSDTASGTGVGNPGKVTVSILADTVNTRAIPRKLTIVSTDGLPFTITEAFLSVEQMSFISDEGTFVKEGPYKFNALTGNTEPEIKYDDLPYTTYYGLDFVVEIDKEAVNTYSIILNGTFVYKEQTREFSLNLNIFGNTSDHYDIEGGSAIVDEESFNIFKIDMEADNWLNHIEFKQHLNEGNLSLNSDGNLIVDSESGSQIYRSLAAQVKQNIFKSGKLSIEYK